MVKLNKKLLKELVETPGCPGFETRIQDIVERELKPLGGKVRRDVMGNVIGHFPATTKQSKGRIMVAGHMDEIGFVVTHVDDNGFIRISPLGGFDGRVLTAQRAWVLGKKDLVGVMSVSEKPIHLQRGEAPKPAKVKDVFIDVGMPADKVRELVEIGTPVTLFQQMAELGTGEAISCKSMDDRIAVFVIIEAMRKVKKHSWDIYAVGTVQEEVGCRGATTCSFEIEPELSIAVDITMANDIPGIEKQDQICKLGDGVALKICDGYSISDPTLVKEFRALADKKKINYQLEVLPFGGTDAGPMQRARGGSRAITLSIPTRYGHTCQETVYASDVQGAIDLLAEYLSR